MMLKVKIKNAVRKNPGNIQGRVLLMDDQESIRNMLAKMLFYLGYEVEFAEEGTKAVDLYKRAMKSRQPFDFVILDIVIPYGMGGKETVQKLREIDPGIKAIVSSGYSDDPIMSDYRRYGFCGMLAKPFQIEELREVLYKVIKETKKSLSTVFG
jgi:DNA-binding NtrC family response regulator